MFRVNAACAKTEQTLSTGLVSFMDNIGLDQEILGDKFRRVRRIGQNAANPCCGNKDIFRMLRLKELPDVLALCQVQLA